jgi:hypothetical protein
MKTKRLFLATVLVALAALALPTAAFANFAIHGSYIQDDDACAGCHRAHTSVSTIGWTDTLGTQHDSALLVTSATEMWQFCYACHDATSQGADTNVQQGLYEGSLYGTQNAILNGGGFDSLGETNTVTSTHMYKGGSWGAYGGGYFGQGKVGANGAPPTTGTGNTIKMDCATCHDPHGSANYRILKGVVNGNTRGIYTDTGPTPQDPDPDGYVSSVETGWPINGFRLHVPVDATYQPNYTTPMYAKGYDMKTVNVSNPDPALNNQKGMSGWCSGCHSTYLGQLETKSINGTDYASFASTYNAGDDAGMQVRHRHPINVPLTNYKGPDANQMVTDNTSGLPLANDLNETVNNTLKNEPSDWIECLTCHRAHGTAAKMEGWAANAGAASIVSSDGVARNNFPARGINGVTPSNLLRYDNRGVCERCHNK